MKHHTTTSHKSRGFSKDMKATQPGAVKITLHSANDEVDEKAEVTIALSNPECAVEKMFNTLAQRFPPESVMTISPANNISSSSSSEENYSLYASQSSASHRHMAAEQSSSQQARPHHHAHHHDQSSGSPQPMSSISRRSDSHGQHSSGQQRRAHSGNGQGRETTGDSQQLKTVMLNSAYAYVPFELKSEASSFKTELVDYLISTDSRHLDDFLRFAQAGEDPKGWAVAQGLNPRLAREVVDLLIIDPSFFAWVAKLSGASKLHNAGRLDAAMRVPSKASSKSAQRKKGNQSHESMTSSHSSKEQDPGFRGYASDSQYVHSFGPKRQMAETAHFDVSDSDSRKPLYGRDGKPIIGPDGGFIYARPEGQMMTMDGRRPVTFDRDGFPIYANGKGQTDKRTGGDISDGVVDSGADDRSRSRPDSGFIYLYSNSGKRIKDNEGSPLMMTNDGLKQKNGSSIHYDKFGIPTLRNGQILTGPGGAKLVDPQGRHLLRVGQPVYDSSAEPQHTLDGQKVVIGPQGKLVTTDYKCPVFIDSSGHLLSSEDGRSSQLYDQSRQYGAQGGYPIGTQITTETHTGYSGRPTSGVGVTQYGQTGRRQSSSQEEHHIGADKGKYHGAGSAEDTYSGAEGMETRDVSGRAFIAATRPVYGPTGTHLCGPDGRGLMINKDGRLTLSNLRTYVEFDQDGIPTYGRGRVLVDEVGQAILGGNGEQIIGPSCPLFEVSGAPCSVNGQLVMMSESGFAMNQEGKGVLFDAEGHPHVMSRIVGRPTSQTGTARRDELSSSPHDNMIHHMTVDTTTVKSTSPHMPESELEDRVEILSDGTRVRYVEVPVIEEKIITVPKKEVVEVEKRVSKKEYVEVETVVETPQIEYVDKQVEVEQIHEVIKHVPIHQVVEVPKEVIRHVPRVEIKYVEKVVEVPGHIIEVPKPYTVENKVHVPVYSDKTVPSVVAQRLQPIIRDTGMHNVIDAKRYEPILFPVDVYIPKPIPSQFVSMGKGEEVHNVVDVPPAQFNTLVRNLNFGLPEAALGDLYIRQAGGSIPLLPTSEHVEVVHPVGQEGVMKSTVVGGTSTLSMPTTYSLMPTTVHEMESASIARSLVHDGGSVGGRGTSVHKSSRKDKPRSSSVKHSRRRHHSQDTALLVTTRATSHTKGDVVVMPSTCDVTSTDLRRLRRELADAEMKYAKQHKRVSGNPV